MIFPVQSMIWFHASGSDSLQRLLGQTLRIFANLCAYKRQQLERFLFFSERILLRKKEIFPFCSFLLLTFELGLLIINGSQDETDCIVLKGNRRRG